MTTAQQQLNHRLADIASWEDGWHDGDGRRVHSQSLKNATRTLNGLIELGLDKPRVGLDEDGHVCAEFDGTTYSALLEFTPTHVLAQALDTKTMRGWEEDFDAQENASRIYRFIKDAHGN